MSRPPALYPLFAGVETLPGIGAKTARLLAQAGIETVRDLLFTLPHGGIDRRRRASILEVAPPAVATVEVTVGRHHRPRRRGGPARVEVTDARTAFQLVFFHARGDWLERTLPEGARRLVSGRVELFDGVAQMVHPDHVLPLEDAGGVPAFEPVYPLTEGVTQRVMARAAEAALDRLFEPGEWIEPGLLAREGWPGWAAALRAAHAPGDALALSPDAPARRRLAYDEFLAHQVTLALARQRDRRRKGRASPGTGVLRARVLAALPYAPTGAQVRALAAIDADMASDARMSRLLHGDVGAGKTLVAFLALLTAVEAGGQGALMAPTEVLARQHLEALRPLAGTAQVVVEILTGRDRGPERAAKLAALAGGRIHILVGTHALFQDDVAFADLRLAVIDEQHRFGVAQRMELSAKGVADVLVMTATPIPRSLALAQYGHMDVSVLDEKPPGRLPVTTALIAAGRFDEVVAHLRRAVAEGRQAYWVCPLVEEGGTRALASAEARAANLRAALGAGAVGLVHGQLPAPEKDAAMADFVAGTTRVLVATTVIEVGVNVPAASIMVIEGAESFGLAQLHQLRGRVGRGAARSTCLLLYATPLSEAARQRLDLMRETEDGFRIAEADLAMRGAGDLIGMAQAGLPRFRIGDPVRQAGLMAVAQSDARSLVEGGGGVQAARWQAARLLLWLLRQDEALRLLDVG